MNCAKIISNLLPIRTQTQAEADSPSHPILESVDARMISIMRLLLALSALAIIYIDPVEPQRLVGLTYGSIAAYCTYSAFLYYLAATSPALLSNRIIHWADVLFFVYLVALTGGSNSIFFFFFFFAILATSFRWGFREGLLVTVSSAVLFTAAGLLVASSGQDFEINRTLIRPLSLLVLGYMIAFWGERENLLKRRLRLLRDVNNFSNPRFGIDRTLVSNMQRLVNFCDADACILVLANEESPDYLAYHIQRGNPDGALQPRRISEDEARPLLGIAAAHAIAFTRLPLPWWQRREGLFAHDTLNTLNGTTTEVSREIGETLADLLDSDSLLTVPLQHRGSNFGRLFLTSCRRSFSRSEIEFLIQLVQQIMPMIQNIRLLDRFASTAAERERQNISRDLHDTIIQPYVGIKLGLEALSRKAGADNPLAGELKEMADLAGAVVEDLRRYAGQLKNGAGNSADFLFPALQRQAVQFRQLYGIALDITGRSGLEGINDRLAADMYQIACEGISNIRRHTNARRAYVDISTGDGKLNMAIGNETSPGAEGAVEFTPRSIAERAKALGGSAHVEHRAEGYTVVYVTIPL